MIVISLVIVNMAMTVLDDYEDSDDCRLTAVMMMVMTY